jgi:hypothetical protein
MNKVEMLERLKVVEDRLADLRIQHRRAMNTPDFDLVTRIQEAISDLIEIKDELQLSNS